MHVFGSAAELLAAVGAELGHSGWLVVDQQRIDRFAAATDDHQWIHVDPARAADGPFGATVAHGFLTLSLLARFTAETYRVDGARAEINCGTDRVRFLHPVRVGSRIRASTRVATAVAVGDAVQFTTAHKITVVIGGRERPACLAESSSRITF